MLDAQFQRRCEGLHRQAQRAWGRQFLGRRRRLRVAGGTEATGAGDYTTGDELRYVDWNLCARHDELVTRQFMGTEDHTVYFLLDCSRSMNIAGGRKFELARELAASLGYLALANHDSVWVGSFAASLVGQLPAMRGRRAVPRLFEFLSEQSPTGSATALESVIESFTALHVQRGMVVLLSDMLEVQNFDSAIDSLRLRGFEPLLIHVLDQHDAEPAAYGKVVLEDVESDQRRRDYLDEQDAQYYRGAFSRFCRRVRGYFHRFGLGIVPVYAHDRLTHCVERIVLGSVERRHTRAGVR